jgi:hypothetical protein
MIQVFILPVQDVIAPDDLCDVWQNCAHASGWLGRKIEGCD